MGWNGYGLGNFMGHEMFSHLQVVHDTFGGK